MTFFHVSLGNMRVDGEAPFFIAFKEFKILIAFPRDMRVNGNGESLVDEKTIGSCSAEEVSVHLSHPNHIIVSVIITTHPSNGGGGGDCILRGGKESIYCLSK